MKKSIAALVCAAAFSLTASADSSYTYAAGDTSLGNGAVTITYASGTTDIATLTANPSNGETITLTGGAATFAAGATFTLASSGTVAFAEKVTTLGALTFERGDDAYRVWTGSALSETDPGVCAFPDIVTNDQVSAADVNNTWECIHVVAGVPNSNHNSRNHMNVGGRFDNIGGKIGNGEFVALNRVADSFVYSIRVQLSPMADGLYARCRTGVRSPRFGLYPDQEASWVKKSLWASWPKSDTNWGYYGKSSDASSVGGTWLDNVAYMGLNRIVLKRKSVVGGPMKVCFDGGVTLGGTTTIPFGMEAIVATSEGDGAVDISQTINGEGDLTFVSMPATTAFTGTTYMDGFISTSWKVLAENRSLATMTSIEGYMQGAGHNAGDGSTPSSSPSKCGTFHYHYNPADDTATCQFQYNRTNPTNPPDPAGSTTKYVVAKFRQNGPNVEIAAVGNGYANPGIYGTEFPTKKETTANYKITSWSSSVSTLINESVGYAYSTNYTGGYGIRKVTATFGGETTRGFVTISGDIKALYGSKVTLSGKDNMNLYADVTSLTGLPAGGEVHVREGNLYLSGPNDPPGGGTTRLFIHQGCELRNMTPWQIGTFQDIVLDGGTYNGYSTTLYVNYVVLSNAVMKGTSPRVINNNYDQCWHVIGDAPSTISCNNGANVYGAASESSARSSNVAFRMDVEDVTGDSDVDCTLKQIRGASDRTESQSPPRASFRWFMFEKYGAGMLKITDDSREVWMESKLIGGTLLLAGNNIMTNEVQLLGGNLAIDAGKSNSLGTLSATTNGTLTVGAGGSLSFASFAPGANLAIGAITIKAPMGGNVLRIGTDDSGLAGQSKYFRWQDETDPNKLWRVYQDENGYVHPRNLSGRIIVR